MNVNKQYQQLLNEILTKGYKYTDQKRDVVCQQIDDYKLDIDLTKGFPAINLKKLYWRGVVGELLWFLRGDTNIKYLVDNNIHIWDKDAYNWFLKDKPVIIEHTKRYLDMIPENKSINKSFEQDNKAHYDLFIGTVIRGNQGTGELGRVYGAQWRNWGLHIEKAMDGLEIGTYYVDQISSLVKNLKEQPMSRRHIVTAWNPAELDDMALPPCHWSFEIIVRPLSLADRILELRKQGATWDVPVKNWGKIFKKWNIPEYGFTLKWHQRSVDTYLGLPFNIASYALLAHIIGKLTNMKPLRLIGDLSNVHLYENSWDAAKELLERKADKYYLPSLKIDDEALLYIDHKRDNNYSLTDSFNQLKIEDFTLSNYKSYDNIKVEMLAPKNK